MNLPEGSTTLLMVGGIVLASWLLLRGSRARWAKSRKNVVDPQAVRRQLDEQDQPASMQSAPAEVLRWQVELHDTARDLKAEIDSKLVALDALTRMARQEADRLERLLKEAEKK